jgi:hypothetical protein
MMFLWACAGVPLGVYNIVKDFNIALQIQPQILTFLSLITLGQCIYYEQVYYSLCLPGLTMQKYSFLKCIAVIMPIGINMATIEMVAVFGLRVILSRDGVNTQVPEQKGVEWPMTLTAIFAACLLAAGVLRHYWDIYVYRTVRGISFVFVAIDAAGDLFSLLSLGFSPITSN